MQVQALFADCGEINAITIPVDKFSGRAKGFAYLEFAAKVASSHTHIRAHIHTMPTLTLRIQESVLTAMEKNNALLRDRPIKVVNKRTNLPAWQTTPRGRGGRGRGGFRGGGYRGRAGFRGGYRGRGRGFSPY